MINDDVLIKKSRLRGHKYDWPQEVRYMKERLEQVKLGFPGIGNDHIDLIEYKDIKEGDIFIYDCYLENADDTGYDTAPKMYRVIKTGLMVVEGIGTGLDLGDKERAIKWRDIVKPNIDSISLVLRVNVRPNETGGPGYYYFFKSTRDFRK